MDIIKVRDAGVIASEINYIKKKTCETMLANSVEIGRLLVEAKQKVPTGEWMKWLSENVSYSQSNANNLMRLYEEYGEKEQIGFFEENRLEIFGTLTPSQALALIPLPYEQRREFIETHDMTETSVRDISAEIKAREEAEEREKKTYNELLEERNHVNGLEDQIFDMKIKIQELTAEIEEKTEREAEKPEQIDLDAERDAIKAGLSAQFEQDKAAAVAEAVAEADEKIKGIEEDYAARLKASEEGHAAEIAKIKAAASADVQRFGVVFENFQREGQTLVSLLGKIEDQSVKEKLRGGMRQVMEAYKERVEKA